jgi:hypothetical protein
MGLQLGASVRSAPGLFVENYLSDRHLVDTYTLYKMCRPIDQLQSGKYVFDKLLSTKCRVGQILCQPNVALSNWFVV